VRKELRRKPGFQNFSKPGFFGSVWEEENMQSASALRVRESDIHKFFREGKTMVKRIY